MTAHRHGIIPPWLLERLAEHGPEPAAAERTLSLDEPLREQRIESKITPTSARQLRRATTPSPDRTIADAGGATRLPGRTVRKEHDDPSDDESVNEAFDGLGATWTMLHDSFGRDSLDGAGMPLLATVHYGIRYDNAFWNGERMVFGDGDGEIFNSFTDAVDVIGHELGHGVIEHDSGLVYRDQPGALNESLADVIGVLTKQHLLGQTACEADWLIGAGLFTDKVQGVALRSMAEPGTAYDDPLLGKDPQPGHMRDFVHTASDYGGVHINSGIPNKAFHDVAVALGGHAWLAPGQIWMAALAVATPTSDFVAFATSTVAIAAERFGEESPERAAVEAAWRGVGVLDAGEEPAPAPDPTDEVTVSRTGGMLGRTVSATVAPSDLPKPVERKLEHLAASGELEQIPHRVYPDAYVWRVRIDVRVDVTVSDPDLPDDVRDLLSRILELGS